MFKVLLIFVASIIAGYLLRSNKKLSKTLSFTTPVTIFALLFMFGANIGGSETILSNLHRDGLKAAVIAILGVAGSLAAVSCFKFLNKKGGQR